MFRLKCLMVVATLAAALVVGCDNPDRKPAGASTTGDGTTVPPPAVTTQPATQGAEGSTPAATQPTSQSASSMLIVDGQPVKFPHARLRVSKVNGRVVARLYSDDPESALKDDYRGNSFDLLMHLDDVREPQQVYLSQWQFKARSREFADTQYGIFLDGTNRILQPINVTGKFLGDVMLVRVDLDGEFLEYDRTDVAQQGKSVMVRGSLLAPVEYKD